MAEGIIGHKQYKYNKSLGVTSEAWGVMKTEKTRMNAHSYSDVIVNLANSRKLLDTMKFKVSMVNQGEQIIKFDKLPFFISAGWKITSYAIINEAKEFIKGIPSLPK